MNKEVLYNIATAIGISAFTATAYDGILNLINNRPNPQLVVFITLSTIATYLRIPLLLSDKGTQRERYMFLGVIIMELIACTCNIFAFRTVVSYFAGIAIILLSLTCITLLSRKTLVFHKHTNDFT